MKHHGMSSGHKFKHRATRSNKRRPEINHGGSNLDLDSHIDLHGNKNGLAVQYEVPHFSSRVGFTQGCLEGSTLYF